MQGVFETSIFISHASEDKNDFVRPLVNCLKESGLEVWYDEFALKVGDSLRESIENGIKKCSFGIVILSEKFFEKKWTKKELNALFSKELIKDENLILPIWYKVTLEDVFNYSPFMADKKALTFNGDFDEIANQIIERVSEYTIISGESLEKIIESYKSDLKESIDLKVLEAQHRIEKYFLCMNELYKIFNESQEEYEQYLSNNAEKLRAIREQHPKGIREWLESKTLKRKIAYYKTKITKWIKGELTERQCYSLLCDLDVSIGSDYTYLLLGIPYHTVIRDEYILSEIDNIGCRNSDIKEPLTEREVVVKSLMF